jgi:hypothetical protein
MKRSVTVLDIILTYRSGHFIPSALATERAARYTGAKYIAITDTKCPNAAETNHWLRILRPFDHHKNTINGWRAPKIFRGIGQAWMLNRQLAKASRRSNRVVIHLDCFTTRQLSVVALALTSFKVCSALYRPTEAMLWIQIHGKGDITALGLIPMQLLTVFRIPTRISVYSPDLADLYSARFRRQVIEIPMQISETINRIVVEGSKCDSRCQRRRDEGKIVCLLAGQVIPDKRYEIFEKLLCTANSDLANAGIKIQLRVPQGLGLRGISDRVEIVETPSGQLSEQEYVSMYLTSDVVLMPYTASKYGYSSSGVFIDAVTLGCIPIVSKHTTMASELEKFKLSELSVDWDTFSWDFIASVARNEVVKDKFHKMSLVYRKTYCLHSVADVVSKILW